MQADAANQFTALDLFRYSAPGQHQTVDLRPAYFSINGGSTKLDPFDSTGGDDGDWAASVQGDSFGYGAPGQAEAVTRTDLREMDILGYRLNLPVDTAATLLSDYGASPATAYASISDTAANIASHLDALESLALPSVGAIYATTITDSANSLLHVNAGQLANDGLALGTITAPYSLAVSIGGKRTIAALPHVQNVTIVGAGSLGFSGDALDNTFIVDNTGSDTLDGAGGLNTVSYAGLATAGIRVSLTNGVGAVAKGGSFGNDHLASVQAIDGSSGNDVLHLIGNGTIEGGSGNDTLTAMDTNAATINYLYGGSGVNVFATGPAGTHFEFGGSGQDVFTTGGGTSIISLGSGSETIRIGTATKVASSAAIHLKNFAASHDRVDLSAFGASSAAVLAIVHVTDTAQGAEISATVSGKHEAVYFEGIGASQIDLTGSDFIL